MNLCLNPYSNGMWIERTGMGRQQTHYGLNPYSNGMWIELWCLVIGFAVNMS